MSIWIEKDIYKLQDQVSQLRSEISDMKKNQNFFLERIAVLEKHLGIDKPKKEKKVK